MSKYRETVRGLAHDLGMPSRAIPIRWPGPAYNFIAREAQIAGMSFAEYVRDCSLVGATIDATRRGAPVEARWAEMFEIARQLEDDI